MLFVFHCQFLSHQIDNIHTLTHTHIHLVCLYKKETSVPVAARPRLPSLILISSQHAVFFSLFLVFVLCVNMASFIVVLLFVLLFVVFLVLGAATAAAAAC